MTQVIPVSAFPGLDLISSPDEAGCIDACNVESDRPGQVRTRDGYETWSTAPTGTLGSGGVYDGSGHFVVYDSGASGLRALDSNGASVTTVASNDPLAPGTNIGTTSAQSLYLAGGTGAAQLIIKYNGAAFSNPIADLKPRWLAAQPKENRLAAGAPVTTAGIFTAGASRVYFSSAGAPETFSSTDWVDLNPGDGEVITGMTSWGDYLFVFKLTKFFVFYGNSTDQTGGVVFNYRSVDIGSRPASGANHTPCTAGLDGVWFANQEGIFRTTGDRPQLVSYPLNPMMQGSGFSYFQGGGYSRPRSIVALNHKVYVSFDVVDSDPVACAMLVYDTRTNAWTYWEPTNAPRFLARGTQDSDGNDRLFSMDAAASGDIRAWTRGLTSDSGTAITSRYRTGFTDFGYPGREKDIDSTRLWGTGTVSVAGSRDFGDLDTATAVTLGTSPDVAAGLHNKQKLGELISYEFSGTAPWTLHRYAHMNVDIGPPGERTA